jgi:hypothetical protein
MRMRQGTSEHAHPFSSHLSLTDGIRPRQVMGKKKDDPKKKAH